MTKELVTKKELVKLLWKYSFGQYRGNELPEIAKLGFEDADENKYPEFLAQIMLDKFVITKREVSPRKTNKTKGVK